MDRVSFGQEIAAELLPLLMQERSEDGKGRRDAGHRHVWSARRLWSILQPQLRSRQELARAVERARTTPSAPSRSRLVTELEQLFAENPRLAARLRRRVRLTSAADAVRESLAWAWPLVILGLVAGAVTLFLLGWSTALAALAIGVLGAAVFVAVLYQRLRLFAWMVNWLLVFAVIVAVALAASPDSIREDAENAKLFAIILLSILPGWLYLQFIAIRGRSLWEDYVINLFRLHVDDYRNLPEPPKNTVEHDLWRRATADRSPDAGLLYRRKFEQAYGRVISGAYSGEGAARFRGEGFAPVVFTTLLTAFGWTIVLAPTYPDAMVFGNGFDGRMPLWEALAFAFVGAYWFNLQSIARRYFQNDLRTAAYISATTRIIIVALLTAVVYQIWSFAAPQASSVQEVAALNGTAFLIGVFPNLGLQILQKSLLRVVGKVSGLQNQFPLLHLDGLNMWYEARFVEEGIEDMQNLATADLVHLLLTVQVPVGRLVDWVDQSHLYLRVVDARTRESLRRLGIRAATDLLDACGDTRTKDQEPRLAALRRALFPDGGDEVGAVELLTTSLVGEVNLHHVQAWRAFEARVSRPEPHSVGAHAGNGAGSGPAGGGAAGASGLAVVPTSP